MPIVLPDLPTTTVTPDDVRKIIKLNATFTDEIIQEFIDSAHQMVTERISSAPCHTEASLRQVELWLSAHYVSIRADKKSVVKIGDGADTYRKPTVLLKGFDSSYEGQAAVGFDCSRKLLGVGKKAFLFSPFGGGDTPTPVTS